MINSQLASTRKRNHLGKFYETIDFSLNQYNSRHLSGEKNEPIGQLLIGNATFDLSYSEINYLIETLQDAQECFEKSIKLGVDVRKK